MPISYIAGLSVKPLDVSAIGVVTFTNGMLDAESLPIPITPNQRQCEAYGYTYNQADGTCSAFRYNSNLDRNFSNIKNKTYGARNTTESGTINTLIMGENNTTRSFTRNNIITGSNNEISNGVNNVSVSGTLGEATADNSIVLGGNAGSDILGKRQSIQLIYGVTTTEGATVDSYLNGIAGSYFVVPENTAIIFVADILAIRVGGEGTVGDFKTWIETGVVVNKSGDVTVDSSTISHSSSGATGGWDAESKVSGTNYIMSVEGDDDNTIEWVSNIRFTQLKTGVTL